MDIKNIKAVYFIGAGGIGMSAIARYFIKKGYVVAGYDKTPTPLTQQLEKEGMLLHYEEDVKEIPQACKNPKSCLVGLYTSHTERPPRAGFLPTKRLRKYKARSSCWVH